MGSSQMTFFTVGHSNQPVERFLELLTFAEISLIVDVRRLPGSTRFPQFNEDTLRQTLNASKIGYERVEALTGRRNKSKTVPDRVNGAWENQSFHNYADYALSSEFEGGLHRIEQLANTHTVALMCSESVWWRCHRRIISDWLLSRGHQVTHIMSGPSLVEAGLTPFAEIRDGRVEYPAAEAKKIL